MKYSRLLAFILLPCFIYSCGKTEKPIPKFIFKRQKELNELVIPVDKGFNEYIAGYTSGIVSVNSVIEIRFTPEFAARIKKQTPLGLFMFEPVIRGKAEWTDEVTLKFKPAKILDPGTVYTGRLNLDRLTEVKEELKTFPIHIQTIKKDFIVTTGILESSEDGASYSLHGEISASDYIASSEVESYLEAKLGKKKLEIKWDHSNILIHKFTVVNIERIDKIQKVELAWDGNKVKVHQKGNTVVNIPQTGDFSVIDLIRNHGEDQSIDIVFSDPIDKTQETEGLIWFSPTKEVTLNVNSNIINIIPISGSEGTADLNIEKSIRNIKGAILNSSFNTRVDFSPAPPSIELIGKGVVLPASQNLIFPFKAVNLKAVDLKIIKIFENNLPHFLQENEINTGYSVKRFGRLLYSGHIDLINPSGNNPGGWNLYTVDLAEYIDVEPGILYKVELSMRPSYSLYPCADQEEMKKFDEMINLSDEKSQEYWDDPENYYSDSDDYIYYSIGYNWRERDNPCKVSYFNPDRKVTRNILASNFGIIAKKGIDNKLHVLVNDLLTALPLSEVDVSVFDFQLQEILSGKTNQDGSVTLDCDRKPFLITAKKDKDRNYLKINDGSSLSLSSFDVAGNKPENGIKAFIFGERDVWRPGDSIFLSIFIKDLNKSLPPDHPVLFELVNPMEQKIDYQVQKIEGKNLLAFKTVTSSEAPTGDYKAQFRIGGALFSKRIRIETIKPNRLKIDLNFPAEILSTSGKTSKGTLNVKWLNGTTAGNLKSSVEFLLKPIKTEFKKFSNYNFDDPVIRYYPETIKMFEGSIDENGYAEVIFNPGDNISAPGMLNAIFTSKVAERGGDVSISQSIHKFSPYPVFVGINLPGLKGSDRMLFTETSNDVKIVTVDLKGNPVDTEVELSAYKISYKWWWESDQEDLASYVSNNIYKPVFTKKIDTKEGEGSFSFKIGKNDWGRYLIRASASSGHSTGKVILIDWPWEYGTKGNSEGATLLSINTDKEKYNPGDEIRISFPSPENARVIVTLENSTSVLETIRTLTTKGNTVVTFKAKPEMAPNVYAYVSVIQPHSQTINDMPMRLYGIVPVMIEDPETRLNPEIVMPDQVRSRQSFEIRVHEKNRKPMTYTLALVDEGLLNITGFKTPDPWNYFYSREALGVQTWDLYDFVLGAFGGTLERIFAVGGDETMIDRSAGKAQRFVPVVRFFGPFELGSGKTGSHQVTIPNYTGSVRTMVIAGNGKSFGSVEKTVIVKDPLTILATAPRVVSFGEKVALPVTLFVQDDNIKTVEISAEGNELVSFDEKSKVLEVSGKDETDTEFLFTTGEKSGVAKIRINASGQGEKAFYDLELNVRNPNPSETRSELKILSPGEKWEKSFVPFGINGSNSATLEVSILPSVNFEKVFGYLLDYPHGCTEQIISSAFPQLWFKDLSVSDPKAAETASANIREAVNKTVSRQMISGGVAFWPGNSQADNWITSYAGHFMIEAERKGYNIPDEFRQKWVSYQKKVSQDWRFDQKFLHSANDQAYRLFTLALAGAPDRGAMNRLRETQGIPQVSRWFLAAAFATAGRPEVAGDLIDIRNTEPDKELTDYFYGSMLRDQSIILYTLSLLNMNEQALPLLKTICDNLNSDNWFSTQSLAWGLISYMKFAELNPGTRTGNIKFSVTTGEVKSEESLESGKLLIKNLKIRKGSNTILVENDSETPLYVNLVTKGVPSASDITGVEKGINLKVEYLDTRLQIIDRNGLVQGTDFLMVARVNNSAYSRIENIALTQMVPSGWEIRNTRLFEADYGIKESNYDYRDFRDDRVNTYFNLNLGETKTFVLVLNATYKGEFYQPSLWCEAMYTENCYARVPGTRVRVTAKKIE